AKASADARGEQARRELERRLAEEKARREKAEAEAKRNQDLYQQALQLAQKALEERDYDRAILKYQEAGKVFRTDIVLTGLRQAESGKAKARELAAAQKKKEIEEAQKSARLQGLLRDGQAALGARDYDRALKTFAEAKALAPDNVEAL